jgi:hypothetical protein
VPELVDPEVVILDVEKVFECAHSPPESA